MSTSESVLKLDHLTKRFSSIAAVDDVSLSIKRGEFVSLLGPSGCGKTTTLRMIAGYVLPDAGRIWLGDEDITHLPPYHRDIGMVFQNYALFPHMTVGDNVAFGLKMRRISPAEIKTRVEEALSRVRLDGLASRRPNELSGGQQQRVALARATVIRPRLLLLDEPLSNLDAKLRKNMQIEIRSLQESLGITTIHVTHDQAEALSLSDRIVVMAKGQIQQIGTPKEIYRHPQNPMVADFIGEANVMTGKVETTNSETMQVRLSTGELLLAARSKTGSDIRNGSVVILIVRPENIRLSQSNTDENVVQGELSRTFYTGAVYTHIVRLKSGHEIRIETHASRIVEATLLPGKTVSMTIPSESILLFEDS